MDEKLLKRLVEANILTEETSKEIKDTFDAHLEEATKEAREKVEADVRAELTEEFVEVREKLVEAVDQKFNEMFEREIAELRSDIDSFRDLEAEYAEKLVESKASIASELQEDMNQLVDKLDAFVEVALREEVEELREDIERARQQEFGREIFEAVKTSFLSQFQDDDDSAQTYAEMEEKLEESKEELAVARKAHAELKRVIKLDGILAPLQGTQRDVMEALLRNISTEKLEEGYKTFLPRIIRETKEDDSEKEDDTVLAEGADVNDKKAPLDEVVIATGDAVETVVESDEREATAPKVLSEEMKRMLRIAGVLKEDS